MTEDASKNSTWKYAARILVPYNGGTLAQNVEGELNQGMAEKPTREQILEGIRVVLQDAGIVVDDISQITITEMQVWCVLAQN